MEFIHNSGDYYVVTGFYYNSNKKFRIKSENPYYVLGINLWKGNVWHYHNGKRKLIKSV